MARLCSWFLVFVIVGAIGSGEAFAKGKGGKRGGKGAKRGRQTIEQRFNEFDKDKDGKLSKSEFAELKAAEAKQRAQKQFATLDTSHDGSVSLDELKATAAKGGGKKGKKK
jgi:Ca2+-binding EF-hand superfamily protein